MRWEGDSLGQSRAGGARELIWLSVSTPCTGLSFTHDGALHQALTDRLSVPRADIAH